MDSDVKRELLTTTLSAVGVPVLRAAIDHHYRMKTISRQEEMAVEVAERKQEGIQAMAAVRGGGRSVGPAGGRTEPVGLENPGDVYDELENLRQETDCSFCHQVMDSLMDAPPSEAADGYEELRSYVREVDRIKDQDITEAEAEEIVGDLVGRWEVVPQHAAGIS